MYITIIKGREGMDIWEKFLGRGTRRQQNDAIVILKNKLLLKMSFRG